MRLPILLAGASVLALVPGGARTASIAFALRAGADGAICLECHGEDFAPILEKRFVHTPVRAKDCIGCHRPHMSHQRKLLDTTPGRSCAACHDDIVPAKPTSAHRPVAEARCTACHDPHASQFKFNLVKSPSELCGGCHREVATASLARFGHPPVRESCTICHDPHGSASAPSLLKSKVPGLCVRCHASERLASPHMGYPVTKARCTSCHDPHGSSVRGMLHASVHPPVARRNCSQCHEAPLAAFPFRTKKPGAQLCKDCHAQKLAGMLERSRVHWPLAQGECLACHAPHAAKQRGLVKADLVSVCGACHADTVRRQELSPTRHEPVAAGACTRCHDPHGSGAPLLLGALDATALCQSCHDWQKHANHPLGSRFRDPRNPNLTVTCLTCHRAHGTEYEHLTPYPGKDLCMSCHTGLRRS